MHSTPVLRVTDGARGEEAAGAEPRSGDWEALPTASLGGRCECERRLRVGTSRSTSPAPMHDR